MATLNGLPASPELRKLLEQAQKDYQDNLDNLTDAATDDIETAVQRGDLDIKELVDSYARGASQLANDYYDQLRGLWAEQSTEPMPDFVHDRLVDPTRVLWQVEHGFSNTDFNGLTYQQVMEGRARSGMTIEDLWPDMSNVDDAQQFIADMIQASGRLTMQRNIRLDPTKPKWARVCGGAKPCAFCVMLASRGFAYTSEETADFGSGFHDGHCHCSVVPSWGKDDILLQKQAEWKGMYDQAVQSARHAGEKMTPETLCAWLRYNFPGLLRDGVVFDPDMRIPKGSIFAKQLGTLHTLRMNQLLKQAAKSHPDTVRLWARHAGEYRIINTNYTGTAEFDPKAGGIRANLKTIGLKTVFGRPYDVMFHESAHMLDWLMRKDGKWLSELRGGEHPKFGATLFSDAMQLYRKTEKELRLSAADRLKEDLDTLESARRYLDKKHALNRDYLAWLAEHELMYDESAFVGTGHVAALENRLRNMEALLADRMPPSRRDVLSAIADKVHGDDDRDRNGVDYALDDMLFAQFEDYGEWAWMSHPSEDDEYYFSDPSLQMLEAFAEMTAAHLSNPASWDKISRFFPESAKLFDDMVSEAQHG